MVGFAATMPFRRDWHCEPLLDATLGNPEVDAFLSAMNATARADMVERFATARTGLVASAPQ
ncbi:MAG: hypothetical protein P4L66_03785 [Acetobacteraceae bacterium]|nr:hypothetical protein [Acetobacteraceae bacterium]